MLPTAVDWLLADDRMKKIPITLKARGRRTDISCQFERMDLVIEHPFPKVHIFRMSLTPTRVKLLLVLSSDLHYKAVWILDVETARGRPHFQPATLQLGFHLIPDAPIIVPAGNRKADVIDDRRVGGRPGMKNDE